MLLYCISVLYLHLLINRNDLMLLEVFAPSSYQSCRLSLTLDQENIISHITIAWISVYVPTAPSSHGHNECQIWPGELQQFTEAHFNLHPVVHGGDVTPHKVCGGAEGPGNQPEQLQCPHTVLHLCCWSVRLLPRLWIPAGNTARKTQAERYTHANTHTR